MAVDILTPNLDPTQTLASQPGFFDGKMELPSLDLDIPGGNNSIPQELAPGAEPMPEQEIKMAGWGAAIDGVLSARKILKDHENTNPGKDFDLGRPRKQGPNKKQEVDATGTVNKDPPVAEQGQPLEINPDEVSIVEINNDKKTAVRLPIDKVKAGKVHEQYQRFVTDTPFVALKDFNAANLTDEQDVLAVIAAQSEVYSKQIDAKTGGQISYEVTRQMADLIGTSQDKLLKKLLGGQILSSKKPGEQAATMLAVRDLLVAGGQEADRLAKLVANNNSQEIAAAGYESADALAVAMERQFALNGAIHAQVKGAVTETARTLSSYNIGAKGTALRQQAMSDVLKTAGKDMDPKEKAALYLSIEDPIGRANHLRKMRSGGLKTADAFYEYWINALLSSPVTHVVNLLGNTLFAAGQIPTRTVAGLMGYMRRKSTGATDGVQLGEDAAMAMGFAFSSLDAIKIAGKVFKNPQDEIVTKLEPGKKFRPNAISAEYFQLSGMLGKAVDYAGNISTFGRLATRSLAAGDVFFKVMGQRGSIYSDAFRRAARGGETDPHLFAGDIADGIANPLAKDQRNAQKFGRMITFQDDLGDFGRNAQGLASNPIFRWFVPFLKTPANIISRAWEHTPFSMAGKDYRDAIAQGGEGADLARAKVALGTTTMVGVGFLANAGYITGGGPSDPKLKANLKRQNWQPYSIKIGGRFYSYKRIEPHSTIIGLAADLVEIMGNDKQTENAATAAAALGMAFSKNVTSKTWMTGMANLLEAIENPDRYGPKVIQGFISSLVPRIIAQSEKQVDPEKRYVRSLIDAIKKDVPGWSDTLPPTLNIWGEPIVYESHNALTGMINPIYAKDWKPNALDGELDRLKLGFDTPPETMPNTGGKLLFMPWEYHDYSKMAGETAKASFEDLIKTQKYIKSNDLIKKMRIENVYNAAKADAWKWMRTKSKYAKELNESIETQHRDLDKEMKE